MNKFLTSVSSIGAVVLLVTAGCIAERSPGGDQLQCNRLPA